MCSKEAMMLYFENYTTKSVVSCEKQKKLKSAFKERFMTSFVGGAIVFFYFFEGSKKFPTYDIIVICK